MPIFPHEPDYQPLWQDDAPLQRGTRPIDIPAVRWMPATRPDGSCVVVCPGGAYRGLAPHESEPVGLFLNTLGISAAILRYRLSPDYKHPAPLLDVSRAIRSIRHHAQTLGVDPKCVGVLGFSAGGHLASTVSTHFDRGDPDARDPVERQSSRPDLSVLVYPVITLGAPSAHTGSRINLLGPDASEESIAELSNDLHVNGQTPPAFLFHTTSDPAVPVENVLLYASACAAAKVPFELHSFDVDAPHGVGLARDERHHPVLHVWPDLLADWLARQGFGRGRSI